MYSGVVVVVRTYNQECVLFSRPVYVYSTSILFDGLTMQYALRCDDNSFYDSIMSLSESVLLVALQ